MKACKTCLVEKPLDEFYRTGYKEARRSSCKPCYIQNRALRRTTTQVERRRETSRQWRLENPERFEESTRNATLVKKYGITLSTYRELLREQNGVCKICLRGCATGFRLAVDHCHETGVVRGLLCQGCNTSLGKFNHNPALLRRAAKYLEGEPFVS